MLVLRCLRSALVDMVDLERLTGGVDGGAKADEGWTHRSSLMDAADRA